jgi:hypothetical protein
MVRISNKCPPGVLCLTPELLIFGVVIAALLFFFYKKDDKPLNYIAPPPPSNISVEVPGDDRYNRAPKPERDWLSRPDISVIANSPTAIMSTIPTIATQGIPETYQSMGVLKTEDGKLLPLYGRRTSSRSDRFQYYTRTDSYNPVQLPLEYKRHNCQDDIGCDELYDGDKLKIGATGDDATVTIYRFSGPTYVPKVIL